MNDLDSSASIGGTPRARKRPEHIGPPATWENAPVPSPEAIDPKKAEQEAGGRDPVRYGDWELKGLAVDF